MSRLEQVGRALRHVHQAMPHDSAFKHVQGAADYIDDILEPDGTLHLAIGGSPCARGRLVGLDLAKVRAYPGVRAVIAAGDIPGKNDISPSHADEPVFAAEHVMFHGQPIFAVIATIPDPAVRPHGRRKGEQNNDDHFRSIHGHGLTVLTHGITMQASSDYHVSYVR